VLFEFRKLQEREARTAAHLRVVGLLVRGDEERKETDRQLDCLDRCLNDLPEHARALLIRYYQRSGAAKVESRMELARELGIPMNALRIRIHRIKAELLRSIESYMRGCKE
jgi:DNA-directed RNA polymerase specialized sigma24 family protein